MTTYSHTASTWIAAGLADSTNNMVNGNLVKAVTITDNLGNSVLELQDSGIAANSVSPPLFATVTLSAAQVIAAYATPATLVAAPGSGKVIIVKGAYVYTNVSTAFTSITAPIIQYGTTVHGAGTLATGSGLVAGDITAAASQVRNLGAMASGAQTGLTNEAITFSSTAAAAVGTGSTVTFTIEYIVLTATI